MSVNQSNYYQKQSGFTLVELAIVLIIIGVLAGSFIGTLTSRLENQRTSEVNKELDKIKSVLLGFAYSQALPALPCPDCIKKVADGDCPGGVAERDGISDYNGNVCSVATGDVGLIPWVTLGIEGSDPWGTLYRYWVDPEYADLNGFTLASGSGIGAIEEPNFKDVTVPVGATPKDLANSVVAVIFSHGRNTYGGISTDNINRPPIPATNIDEANNDDDALSPTFVSRIATPVDTTIAGGEFDDVVVWVSEMEIKASMVKIGKLP